MSNSTRTKSSGDESPPNSNSDSDSLPPPKSDNSSPPSEKEKSSSPSEDDKSSPPSEKDKSSSPSKDDKSSPPSEKDKSSSPSKDDKSSPPSEKDKSSSPSEDDKSSPPSEKDKSSSPSKDDKSSPPSEKDKSSSPSKDDNSSSPPPPPSDDSESLPPPSTTPTPPSSENSPTPLFSPPPPPAESDESSSPPSPLSSSSPPSPSNEASPPPPSSSGTAISPPSPSELSPPPTDASSSKHVPLPPPAAFIPPSPPSSLSNVAIPLSPGSKWTSILDPRNFLSSPNKDPESTQVTPTPNTNTETTPVKSSPSSNSESTTSPSGETDSSSSRSSSMGSSKAPSHSSTGPIVSVSFAAALLVLVAVLFVVVKRKRRRVQALEYRAPPGGSARSEGYYHKHAKVMGSTSHSSSYYASQQMPSSSSGISSDSNRGFGYHQGTQNSTALKPCFSYEEMAEVTNGFSQENMIGQGGFGCVYKGVLPDGRQVAVKELKAGSGQGEREFRAEVDIISIVHHRHLVSLVGYCIAEYHRLLVYEFVPNDTLEHHLHDKGVPVMEWSKRVKVSIGAARGLAYLHEDCHPRIIHRDIKSANILLDSTFEAKVADFGLAKLSNDTHTHISTRVMGTFGYMAPEYASTGKLTDRSDVYSFGVVLLELITGRKPVDSTQPLGDESLVEWARPLLIDALESGNCEELVDPRLKNNFHKAEMFAMIDAAAACVRHSAPKRPPMVKVARALDSGGEISDLTNGVKYGQSQAFNSDQYSVDIQKFRRMAFTSESESSVQHAPTTREYEKTPNSREHLLQWPVEHSSGQEESETCAIYNKERDGGTRIP